MYVLGLTCIIVLCASIVQNLMGNVDSIWGGEIEEEEWEDENATFMFDIDLEGEDDEDE